MRELPGPLFCFAIYPPDRLLDVNELVRVVTAAESAGFDVVQFPEHMLPPRDSPAMLHNRTWWDLPSLFSFLAAKTTTIRFLLGVSVLPNHQPVNFAKALATLDHVSNGRLILGVGTGWYEDEAHRLGYRFAERGAITDEYLAAMRELWTSDDPRFDGEYVSFADVSFYPKPVQKPHPPILIGGTGQRPFRRIAAAGDGWYPMAGDREEVRRQFAEVRALVRDAGRDPDQLWLRQSITWTAAGLGDETIRRVHDQHGKHGGTTGSTDPRTAVAEVRELLAMGVNLVSVAFAWETPDDLIRQLEEVGREVISSFRRPASGSAE